ncbi:MAG: hypothetical protein WC061_04005 [Melioribacteraceae bacterium]
MKRLLSVVIIIIGLLNAPDSYGQNKKFGLGVIIGEPTGISAKLWTSKVNALAFGVGWSVQGYKFGGSDPDYNKVTRTHIHVDYLWHSFNAVSANGQFPLFYGIGGRINTGPQYSGTFAVRGVFGIAWTPDSTPIDIFMEIVPSLQLVSSTGFGFDAGIGARFFF